MKMLDLHGLSHKEAVTKAENFLIDASLENIYMDCILITGKSASMKSIIIDEVLKPHNFYFYENEGTIKVSSF